MLLLPIIFIIGFIAIVVAIILIVCALIFLIFTPLSIFMFVKSHKRKKQNRRMVPFFPLGFVFASFALDGLIPFLVIGGVYVSQATKLPSDYVSMPMIDQNGYQSEYFTVNGQAYKRLENITFTYNVDEVKGIPFFSYTYSNPLQKINSGNYYKIPLESVGYRLIRGQADKRNTNYDYFALESEYDKVVDYFTNVNNGHNYYYLNTNSGNYAVDSTKLENAEGYLLDNFSKFQFETYPEKEKVKLDDYKIFAEFSVTIYDDMKYASKAHVEYCITNDGWYLIDWTSYQSEYGYKFDEEIQNLINSIYEI